MNIYFLCNPSYDFLLNRFEKKIKIIDNKNSFEKFSSKQMHTATAVIICAELKWDHQYFGELNGLEIAGNMRINGCTAPILITSISELGSDLKANLLFQDSSFIQYFKDRTINYISLQQLVSFTFDQLFKTFPSPLSTDHLKDLSYTLFDKKSFIGEFLHDLFHQLLEIEHWSKKELVLLLNKKERQLTTIYPSKKASLEKSIDTFISTFPKDENFSINELDFHEFSTMVTEAINQTTNNQPAYLNEERIKVLYIDDSDQYLKMLNNKLLKYQIDCLTCKNHLEAIEILNKHPEIKVIICDYRFYDENENIAEFQGYDIIRILAQNGFSKHSVIMLTAFNDNYYPKFLEIYKEVLFSKTKLFSPDSEQQFILFYKMIIEANQRETARQLAMFPNDYYWYFYDMHKKQNDYEDVEKEIDQDAFSFIDAYIKQDKTRHFHPLQGLSSYLDSKTKSEQNLLRSFRDKLRARRRIIGLWQTDQLDKGIHIKLKATEIRKRKWIRCFCLIKANSIDEQLKCEMKNNSLSSNIKRLGFKTAKPPLLHKREDLKTLEYILPEEKKWLEKHFELIQNIKHASHSKN